MKLELIYKNLTTLEGIDLTGVTVLNCSDNKLQTLPSLPSTLKKLCCYDNFLTSLPVLPESLEELYCGHNFLTSLGNLPKKLNTIVCINNQISSIPELPPNLYYLFCSANKLTSLPELPNTLRILHCDENEINTLPYLPSRLNELSWKIGLVKTRLLQHNEKRQKLGLSSVDELPTLQIIDELDEQYTVSRHEPGGDMFNKSKEEINLLLKF